MNPTSNSHPLQAALSTAAEQLMDAVRQNEDLERELGKERTERSREVAVLQAARQMKTAFRAYEEKRDFLDGIKVPAKEKASALEPYRSEVQKARRELFDALERLDGEGSPAPNRTRANGG